MKLEHRRLWLRFAMQGFVPSPAAHRSLELASQKPRPGTSE